MRKKLKCGSVAVELSFLWKQNIEAAYNLNFTFSKSGQMTELDSSFRRGHEVPIDSMRGLK